MKVSVTEEMVITEPIGMAYYKLFRVEYGNVTTTYLWAPNFMNSVILERMLSRDDRSDSDGIVDKIVDLIDELGNRSDVDMEVIEKLQAIIGD